MKRIFKVISKKNLSFTGYVPETAVIPVRMKKNCRNKQPD